MRRQIKLNIETLSLSLCLSVCRGALIGCLFRREIVCPRVAHATLRMRIRLATLRNSLGHDRCGHAWTRHNTLARGSFRRSNSNRESFYWIGDPLVRVESVSRRRADQLTVNPIPWIVPEYQKVRLTRDWKKGNSSCRRY